jgi:signal peptidase I
MMNLSFMNTSVGSEPLRQKQAANPSYFRRSLPLLFSALWPGLGQITKKQTSRGAVYGLAFLATILAAIAFRLPTRYLPFMLAIAALIALAMTALIDSAFVKPRAPWPMFAPALALQLVVMNFIGWTIFMLTGTRLLHMPSISMQPTILLDERVVADYRAFRTAPPQRGDLVIFDRNGTIYLKRIIAIGGDSIEITGKQVKINGTSLVEPYAMNSPDDLDEDNFAATTVPPNQLFVLGDNRGASLDSRRPELGFVPQSSALGRPLYIFRSQETERIGQEFK